MKWSELSKSQRDALILKILAALVAVVAIVMFGIRPMRERMNAQRAELETLEQKILEADRLIQSERRMDAQIGGALAEVHAHFDRGLPPDENPFMWASGPVERHALEFGLKIKNQSPVATQIPDWIRPPDVPKAASKPAARDAADAKPAKDDPMQATPSVKKDPRFRRFAPYQISMSIEGDFRNVLLLFDKLESENVFCNVRALTVMAETERPEVQNLNLVLEWPRHVGALDAAFVKLLNTRSAQP